MKCSPLINDLVAVGRLTVPWCKAKHLGKPVRRSARIRTGHTRPALATWALPSSSCGRASYSRDQRGAIDICACDSLAACATDYGTFAGTVGQHLPVRVLVAREQLFLVCIESLIVAIPARLADAFSTICSAAQTRAARSWNAVRIQQIEAIRVEAKYLVATHFALHRDPTRAMVRSLPLVAGGTRQELPLSWISAKHLAITARLF
jgi:hypothetical protein